MNRPLPIKPTPSSPVTLCITTIAITLLLIPHHHATSQPQLDTITSGIATIQQEATTTTITQTSHSTTLNWNSYNINQGHTITYNQPSTSSIAINNIKDTNPSQILGNINANGRIILLNPNGFYIGPNSTISANTFIAAAANLQQTTYNQNTNTLTLNNPQQTLTGDITLHGTITTTNTTQLIAHHINQNTQATITATNHIALKATHTISLHATHTTTANNSSIDLFANQTITGGGSTNTTNTTITTSYLSLTGDYTATNTTSLTADTILLNHQATITSPTTTIHSTQQSLISATIQSPNTQNPNTQSPNTQNPNTQSPNTQGSTTITSDGTITLLNATITTPQQDITIGSTTTPPTQITINQNTTIDTSHSTNPGTIIIYATNTALYGTILANAITGTGGFIEVSATHHLTFNPTLIQATSTYGTPGTVLIDPENIIITETTLPTVLNLFTSFTAATPGTAITGIGDVVATTDTHVLIGNDNFSGNRGNAYLYNIATETWTDLSTTPGTPFTSLTAQSFFGISVALNDTYALIGASGVGFFRGDAYLYRLDGSNAFTSTCATTGTLTSAWCTLSTTPGTPITSLPGAFPNFGFSVALNDTYALISASGISTRRGDAYLYRLDGSNAFTSTCATTGTLTSAWCTLSDTPGQPITSLFNEANFGNHIALNDTYALISATSAIATRGDAYLYRLDGSNAFTSTCATTGTLTSAWCTLSESTDEPIYSLAIQSFFGSSVALNDTYALIGAQGASSARGDAFLYRLDGTNAFTSTCATTATATSPLNSPWCTLSTTPGTPATSLAVQSFFGASAALNDTYALIGATGVSEFRGEAYLYRLDGTDAFTSTCATTGTLTSPWCAITDIPSFSAPRATLTSGDFTTSSRIALSVSLSSDFILISAVRTTEAAQGNAFLLPFGVLDSIDTSTATFLTPTQVQTMLGIQNTIITANNDITILSSITYTGANSLTLTSMGTINANPLGLATTTTLPTITVPTLTINASGNVGSTPLPLSLISTSLTINAGTNSVFLTHPTDIFNYLSGTITAGSLSLTQTTGDINITSPITLTGTNLTLNAPAGSIFTTLAGTAISAADLTLNSLGNIGSTTTPFIFDTTGALTIGAGTNSVFLAHPTDVSIYLPLSGTAGALSLTQTTGDINITSPITLMGANLILTATAGSIFTTLAGTAISAASLTLSAAGNIGSTTNPLTLDTTGALTIGAGTNSVFLAHPTNAFAYSVATITASSLSLVQTTGDINITSAITLPTATITANNLSLTAQAGAILTTLTASSISAASLTLSAAGNIGSIANPFILTTGALTLNAGTNSVFLAHPTDVSTYLPLSGTAGALSLVQTTGAINITSPITLVGANLILTAQAGSIFTTLTGTAISAADLTLSATGNIGSIANPFFLVTTGALTINAGANSVFLTHPTDVSIYLPLSGTAGALSLVQTTGDINITSPITLMGANLTLTAPAGSIFTTLAGTSISAADLTLSATGDIGSIANPLTLDTTGTLTIGAGTNSVFLAHPTDAFAYSAAIITASSLSLTQTTGDINITSPITLTGTNLILTAQAGAILTTLTGTAITASSLTLNAAGDIGSIANPLTLDTTGTLTIGAGTNSVFLAHPTDAIAYISASLTADTLSLVQTTGDINITSPITLTGTNLILTAQAGAILTTLTGTAISAASLTLNATGDIGSIANPFFLVATGALTLNAGTNAIYLAHPSDVSIYLPLTGTAGSLSLAQTAGDINITSPITLTGTNLTLTAQVGAILTTLTGTAITASSLTLNAAGDIGSIANPLTLDATGTLTFNAGTNSVFLTHPSDVSSYLTADYTADTLSLTQSMGDITIGTVINLPLTNLIFTASDGSITTSISLISAITAQSISLTAGRGDIGSIANPLNLTSTGTLTLNAGTNAIYLTHPSDVSSYLTADYTADTLSLTQSMGDITIGTVINLPLTNLIFTASDGSITTSISLISAITAQSISFTAGRGDIGSVANPFILTSTGAITLNAGTNAIYLAHPTDVLSALNTITYTADTLSLTQLIGDITITTEINLPAVNFAITAPDGAVLTTLSSTSITAQSISLTSGRGDIGSRINPLSFISSGTLTLTAGSNSIFLTHPTDISSYLAANYVARTLDLVQTNGDVAITSAINQPLDSIEITAQSGSISIGTDITLLSLSLQAQGAITTTDSNNIITAAFIELISVGGDIGSEANRIYINPVAGEQNFAFLHFYTAANNGTVSLRRDQNTDETAHTDAMQRIIENLFPAENNIFTVTIYDDASGEFSAENDLRFTLNAITIEDNSGFLPDLLNDILGIFGDDCDNDETDIDVVSYVVEIFCG